MKSTLSQDCSETTSRSPKEYQEFLDAAASMEFNHRFFQRPWVCAHFRPRPNSRLLDIGSYVGANLFYFAPVVAEAVGVEAAQTYIDTSYGFFARLPPELQKRIRTICSLVEDLTFDGDYDHVLCVDVLLHAIDPVAVLCKVHEALSESGDAFLTINESRFRTHVRTPSMDTFKTWCHEAGLEIERAFTDMKQHIIVARRAA